MERSQKAVLREGVAHHTKARPYSIHKSMFSGEGERALYMHWHPEFELCYLESGSLEFMVEDICYPVREGEAIFVPPGLLHWARGAQAGSFWALVFSSELVVDPLQTAAFGKYVQPILQNPAGFCLHLTGGQQWQQEALGDLARIFSGAGQREDSELLVTGLLQVIWHNLYRNGFAPVLGERSLGRSAQRLQEAVRMIHAHYGEELTLQALADAAHMSEGQFCRSFKELTGNTPFSYLKRYRLLQSCVYLSETDKKVSEICMLCGFNNISYFNREFLKMIREKPSVYRAQCREKQR